MITKSDIELIFKNQLEKIKDSGLRQKVVNVWVSGCQKGGWNTLEQLKCVPFTLVTDSMGIDLVTHTITVTEGALGLAKAQLENCGNLPYKINLDRLIAGGLLHDVGKLLEIEIDNNGSYKKAVMECAQGILFQEPYLQLMPVLTTKF